MEVLEGVIQGMNFDLVPVDRYRFRVSHWLLKLGLADILKFPIDLQKLDIEFLVGAENEEALMIINMGGIAYQACPRYPDFTDIPPLWEEIAGEYELAARLPDGMVGSDVLGHTLLWVENGVLQMAGSVGPIIPISQTEFIILSGSFVGETMVFDPETGYIYHQSIVYKPIDYLPGRNKS